MLSVQPIDSSFDYVETYELTNLRTYIKDLKKRVKGWEMYLKEIVYININIYIYYFFDPDRVLFFA